MTSDSLSIHEARRVALAAQGFHRARPNKQVKAADITRVIRQLGLVQIDYVNVVVPAHYQVLFSRLGGYDRTLLDDAIFRHRQFAEHWAHEASIVPVESWPLLAYRRETYRVRPYGFEKFIDQHPDYVAWVLEQVAARGPLTPDELPHPEGTNRRLEHSWVGTVPRAVLETHFGRGHVGIADRRSNFKRVYDLAERVIPEEHYRRKLDRDEAQRELLRTAAKGCGVATSADLADYYRMSVKEAHPRIRELVSAGDLVEVNVEGWREKAYAPRDLQIPKQIEARALLAPFDPLIWFRPRLARLFDFAHRFEIFTPQEKRRWGCYVLPFLMGDRLVARVDLKSDREKRRLQVLASYLEPDAEAGPVAAALREELHAMAAWLNLDFVKVERRGNLAKALSRAQ